VHCATPRVWSEWLVCAAAAAWLAPDASVITAGDAAATSAIANRARIFAFMLFPIEPIGPMGYESTVLNTLTIGHFMSERSPHVSPQIEHSIPSYHGLGFTEKQS
jgi:hypothetical protein